MSAWRSRRRAALALLALAACGDGPSTPRLTPVPTPAEPKARPPAEGDVAAAAILALPPPPPDRMWGQTRVINLLRDRAGASIAVDVWARRTVDFGAVPLAHDLGYGQVSEPLGVTERGSAIVVPAGAGEDGKVLGGFSVGAEADRQLALISMVRGTPTVLSLDEVGGGAPITAPAAGAGQLILVPDALRDAEAGLAATYGSARFYVGDGSTTCRVPRGANPADASVLGGSARPRYEVPSGAVTVSLHRWPGDRCKLAPVFAATIDVPAGKTIWALLHAADGKTLSVLTLEAAL
jgi:hypothetical protein